MYLQLQQFEKPPSGSFGIIPGLRKNSKGAKILESTKRENKRGQPCHVFGGKCIHHMRKLVYEP